MYIIRNKKTRDIISVKETKESVDEWIKRFTETSKDLDTQQPDIEYEVEEVC